MNRTQILLIKLSEECNEVSHRVAKVLQFGYDDVQPGFDSKETNQKRLIGEINDLLGVLEMLELPGVHDEKAMERKRKKVEKYLNYSRKKGILK